MSQICEKKNCPNHATRLARVDGSGKKKWVCEHHYQEYREKRRKIERQNYSRNGKLRDKLRAKRRKELEDKITLQICNVIIQELILFHDPNFWARWFPVREEKGRHIWLWFFKKIGVQRENELEVGFTEKGGVVKCDVACEELGLYIECKRNWTTHRPVTFKAQMEELNSCLLNLVANNIIKENYKLVSYVITKGSPTEDMSGFAKGLKRFLREKRREGHTMDGEFANQFLDDLVALLEKFKPVL